MVREALIVYRRNFRAFLLTSCLLYVPNEAIYQIHSVFLARGERSTLSTVSEVVIEVAGFFSYAVTCAALTILAADLQTGGRWSWREAWSRALARARPVVTGSLAFVLLATLFLLLYAVVFVAICGPEAGLRNLWTIVWIFLILAPLSSLSAPVAMLEGLGGFRSLGRSWRLLRAPFRWKTIAALVLVNAPLLAPSTFVRLLLPGHDTLAFWVGAILLVFSNPLAALVALSVYRRTRAEQDAFTDADLRSALDAIE